MIKLPGTGTDGLLDRVETVQNFHCSSLLSKWKYGREALRMFLEPKSVSGRPSHTFFQSEYLHFLWIIQPKSESSPDERASLRLCKLVPCRSQLRRLPRSRVK